MQTIACVGSMIAVDAAWLRSTGIRMDDESMKVQGHCHCGNLRFEAEVDPARVSICHCTDCQTLTGSVYRVSVPAAASDFVMRSGTPKIYLKMAASGNLRAQAFCAECGTPIYASAAENPQTYALRVGALEQRADLPPQRQIWCQSALPWATDIRGLAGLDRE
jgi:hypothetical protein